MLNDRYYRLPNTNLTNAEKDILQYYAVGLKIDEIASKKIISTKTVENHLKNAYDKLNCKNNSRLAICKALRLGIIRLY